jgi:hypothetical protein
MIPDRLQEYSRLLQAQYRAAQLDQKAAFARVQELLNARQTQGIHRPDWDEARGAWNEARRRSGELRDRMVALAGVEDLYAKLPAEERSKMFSEDFLRGLLREAELFPMPWDESWSGKK